MASLYLTDVAGDGQTMATAFRASGFTGVSHAVLMIDQAKKKAIVYSPSDAVAGSGIRLLLSAADHAALVVAAKTTTPTAAQLTTIINWATNAGYPAPSSQTTWWDILHFLAHQVNPQADLEQTLAV